MPDDLRPGDSPASHEGTDLEPDERDDEVLTMTRRDLRILVNGILKDHVRLDTVTVEDIRP